VSFKYRGLNIFCQVFTTGMTAFGIHLMSPVLPISKVLYVLLAGVLIVTGAWYMRLYISSWKQCVEADKD
jgi:hypothetical protein